MPCPYRHAMPEADDRFVCSHPRVHSLGSQVSDIVCGLCEDRLVDLPPRPLASLVSSAQVVVKKTCGAGCKLTRLIASLGETHSPECNCEKHAAEMDEMGPQWCRENIHNTLFWMEEESKARKIPFYRKHAKWLVLLAIRLVEENRDPSRMELARLKAMRFGKAIIAARSPEQPSLLESAASPAHRPES